MNIPFHALYKTLITDYPWLWDAPSRTIAEDVYREHFALGRTFDWFPYINYYKLDLFNATVKEFESDVVSLVKDKLFSFSAQMAGQNLILHAKFQFSKNTHVSCYIAGHPQNVDAHVCYLDFVTNNGKEVLDLYEQFTPYEYKTEDVKGFGGVSKGFGA